MLAKSISALAILAVAGSAVAEPLVYRAVMKTEGRDVFGLDRRDDSVYAPTQTVCSDNGTTCAEACGNGYVQCASSDNDFHCFNPAASQTCCAGGSGMSCDTGYFCASDLMGATYCCQNGLSLTDCASEYGVSANLASMSTLAPASTTSSSTSATSSSVADSNSTTTDSNSTSSSGTTSSATLPSKSSAAKTTAGPTSTSTTQNMAGIVSGPTGLALAMAGVILAALL